MSLQPQSGRQLLRPSRAPAGVSVIPLAPPPYGAFVDRLFFIVLLSTAALKLVLAALIPLTGDEAYFVVWGRFPDYGYYDHGAMTGWWTGATLLMGKSAFVLRLPAILTPISGALLLRDALRPIDQAKASLVATLFLLAPVNLLNVLMTADTPLLLFSLLAGLFAIRAVRRDRPAEWVIAGVFLGFAFLAKYLAVLLGLAVTVYLLLCGGRHRFSSIIALLMGAAPGVALNVVWNYNNGWANVLFNAFTRHAGAHFSLASPLLFLLYLFAVLGGPVVVYFLLRPHLEGRRTWRETWSALRDSGTLIALYAVVVPAAVFFGLSFGRRIGLHWLFSFYPFFFLVLAAKFDVAALQRQVRPMLVYATACTAAALVLLALPSETLKGHRSYNSVVLGTYPQEVLAQLAPYTVDYTLVSPSYTQSAQLSFHTAQHVPVIGHGSMHGRQDDFITDFRAYNGRNLMVLSARAKDAVAMYPFFESVEPREIQVHGARLALALGRGFKFEAYRDTVLRRAASEYYRMPGWLAPWSRPAPFVKRYDLESAVAP